MSVDSNRLDKLRGRPYDGQALKHLVEAGLTWLKTNQQTVNSLNVFPVPDGDTGTNMTLTMTSAWNEIKDSGERHAGRMAGLVAKGALMGARGNSGVILSQLWRGFARGLQDHEVIDAPGLARAFADARDTAYKGVVKPVEGTILTVGKDTAAAAEAALAETMDPITILERCVAAADASVSRTPELLPVLKQAGVVDSGGKGLFYILEGSLRHIYGQPLDAPLATVQPLSALKFDNAMEAVEEGQDFEVVVDFYPNSQFDLRTFYDRLEQMGTSIQVGEGEGMYRMHIHVPTDKRYEPVDYIMGIGTITKVAMENLVAQMEELESKGKGARLELAKVQPGQIGVVVVSPGPGLSRIFASLGVAAIVEGGQTMNPSTQEILTALDNLSTDHVIILPNNKNIVMTANQAKDVTVKKVAVVPSKSIPQGLAAMLVHDPDGDLDAVAERMTKALGTVHAGEITVATRTVEIDGVDVKEGEAIALLDGKLVASAPSVEQALLELLQKANADEHELVTLIYGEDVSQNEANHMSDAVRQVHPRLEIELQNGGQPHYQYIVSIE
ncbi:MAG TPA: DAK2 domain-containing protein [Anaerolineales bacterium]|nr:DAK2 domain-containing protein [Anaerolineales bacterium]